MMFSFKQFTVDQTGCAMKVNTDGVLLGALAGDGNVQKALDIGTGTGVIALMLAQRFKNAQIDAVELDETAAATALRNFTASGYAARLKNHAVGFQNYFAHNAQQQYDLIVSNPPFYIRSLISPTAGKSLAKHADNMFFEQLIANCALHLTPYGGFWLILPIATAQLVTQLAAANNLYVHQHINILSYPHSAPHRQVLAFGFQTVSTVQRQVVIYHAPGVYTDGYRALLKEFLTIF